VANGQKGLGAVRVKLDRRLIVCWEEVSESTMGRGKRLEGEGIPVGRISSGAQRNKNANRKRNTSEEEVNSGGKSQEGI